MGTCHGRVWFAHVNGVWQLIFEVHDGSVILYGGGCGVPPIGGGVGCVYNGNKGKRAHQYVFSRLHHKFVEWYQHLIKSTTMHWNSIWYSSPCPMYISMPQVLITTLKPNSVPYTAKVFSVVMTIWYHVPHLITYVTCSFYTYEFQFCRYRLSAMYGLTNPTLPPIVLWPHNPLDIQSSFAHHPHGCPTLEHYVM